MLTIGGERVLIGGFHDHWLRNQTDNPALLMAAMDYYHYDFMCLMDGFGPRARRLKASIEAYSPARRVYLGEERCFGWGHVVTVRNHVTDVRSDDPDFRGVLRRMREGGGLVALAHPDFPVTRERIFLSGEIGGLVDDGCVDAVELDFRDEYREWLRLREAAGRTTPVVSGWDSHVIAPVRELPQVLYTPDRRPDGHIDAAGGERTLVFAGENAFEATAEAVRGGRTVLENLRTGELMGPHRWVKHLEANGYREIARGLDARRDGTTLRLDGEAVSGDVLTMRFSRPGRVRMPGSLDSPAEYETDAGGGLEMGRLPVLLDRDVTRMPVVFTDAEGRGRTFAVEIRHPIRFDLLPRMRGGRWFVELTRAGTFRGEVRVRVAGVLPEPAVVSSDETEIPVGAASVSTRACGYEARAHDGRGIARGLDGYLTFIPVPVLAESFGEDNWAGVPACRADSPAFVGGYGANRPYPGADVFSAEMRFAWTRGAFLFRAKVTDPVHHQPFSGHHVYQADAIQLALDPLLRRQEMMGAVYAFNLALTPEGPEVWRWKAPTEEAGAGFTPPEEDVSLGGRYLDVARWERGLIYTLELPWEELAPVVERNRLEAGKRIGVYVILKNNNGRGLVDSLQWPRPLRGMWLVPRRWGVLTLVE